VYGWIWRLLPFGRPGKAIGSLLLAGIMGVVLWYGVFPYAERWLPNNDGQITDTGGQQQDGQPGGPAASGGPAGPGAHPTESLPPSDLIPYSTTENNPTPRPSR
jgi:hypothetical protein